MLGEVARNVRTTPRDTVVELQPNSAGVLSYSFLVVLFDVVLKHVPAEHCDCVHSQQYDLCFLLMLKCCRRVYLVTKRGDPCECV